MTQRFEVPEPSEEAVQAFYDAAEKLSGGLNAAYAVDVPRIVRAEVERALRWQGEEDARDYITGNRYLASRFGPASEPIVFQGNLPQPTPSAPAEPTTATATTQCRTCQKWFVWNPETEGFGCLVHHAAGTCCHFHETEVAAPPSEAPEPVRCAANGPKAYSATECCCGGDGGAHLMACPAGVAAARPEANHCPECGKECPANPTVRPGHGATLCLECVEKRFGTLCTACACERCAAERAFVRELAHEWIDKALSVQRGQVVAPVHDITVDAARKVVG